MKWEELESSQNVEDRRGQSPSAGGRGGRVGAGGIGLGTMLILGVVGWALGINPAVLIGGAQMLDSMRSRAPAPQEQAVRVQAATPAAAKPRRTKATWWMRSLRK